MRTTLQQIADEVGVDRSAVSRVLNGKAAEIRLSAQKVDHILQVARARQFQPNTAARAVASGRHGCIALLLSTERNRSNLPPLLLGAIQEQLLERQLRLTVAQLPDAQLTDSGFVPGILREYSADGLLIDYTDHIPPAMIDLIRQHRLPSVWINNKMEADSVYPDDFDAGRQAASRLLALGHRRIAFVDYSAPLDTVASAHYSSHDRYAGYEQAMRQAGAGPWAIRPSTIVPHAHQLEYTRSWLAGPDRPTAVIVYGSGVTLGSILYASAQQGLRIPQNLSIVTFADGPANDAGFTIDTFVVPVREVGLRATQRLIHKVEQGQASPNAPLAIPFKHLPGNSTSVPGK